MIWARFSAACLALCLGLLAAPPVRGAVDPAAPPVRGAADRDVFIVALRLPPDGDEAGVESQAAALAKQYGGEVHHIYASALRGFSVSMSAQQAAELAADRRVATIEHNQVFTSQAAPWGLDRVNQRALPLDGIGVRGGSAAGVTAYVIDSGLRLTHAEFGGRARYGYDAVDSDLVAQDCYGHGTHVAGILGGATYGVAKDVSLVGVRVLDCAGYGTTAEIVAGIDWVTANAQRPAVVNISLQSGRSSAIDRAVRSSIATGIPYVVSAGNQNADACEASPSGAREAITVGATTRADERATFSNGGRCVDLSAPGVAVESAWFTDDTSARSASGTSMAAPHVSGAVALLLATSPRATPADIASVLLETSTRNVVSGLRRDTPNRLLYVGDTEPKR